MTNINRTQLPSIVFTTIFITAISMPVMAHVRWALDSVTPPRTNDTGLKTAPCGGAQRTTRSTIFSAGQTTEVEFQETINHPGHYRIAFSPAGDMNFDSYVLVDNIPDTTNTGFYKQEITIPMQICSECTLQLIQVMTTDPNPQPGDFYYSCSDIQITDPGDTTAPAPVTNIVSLQGDSQVTLNWSNPADDFYQVVVLKDTSPILETPNNGVIYTAGDSINGIDIAYVGNASSFTATSLTNETPYYFKVFAQNPRKNYADGVEANSTPSASATGGSNNNTGGADNGGGSSNIFYLFLLLFIRVMGSRKFVPRK
jgi:hypothetical protein